MPKYITLFDTHTDYQTYINGQDKVLPNVSYCEDNHDMHYNPWTDPRIIAKFNVTSTSSTTVIVGNLGNSSTPLFSEIEIDGVVQPSVVSRYTFDTTGEHTVKYTLTDSTTIGNSAFNNCTNLISVTIPNSVTTINDGAFNHCTSLTSVAIPNSVTSIGSGTFYGCSGLTNIIIPDNVTTLGTNVFQGCTSLTNATIGSGVTSIGTATFQGCTGLTSVTIPNSVTSINNAAFADCTGLTSVTIPDSVTSIGNNVFGNCTGLINVIIGSGVTTIGGGAFYGCTGLTSITIQATTPPTILYSFSNTTCPIYVPSASVDTYKAASSWSDDASRIQAIP